MRSFPASSGEAFHHVTVLAEIGVAALSLPKVLSTLGRQVHLQLYYGISMDIESSHRI